MPRFRVLLTAALAALWLAGGFAGDARAAKASHVIQISVDGLASYLLEDLLSGEEAASYASFQRLIDEGASTFEARTDYTQTVTLPNHTCMLTGRPAERPAGQPATVHHGYLANADVDPSWTLHNRGNPELSYVASSFDVAHDAGLHTGLYASKGKFIIFEQSWNAANGAPDETGEDNGRDKIDVYESGSASMFDGTRFDTLPTQTALLGGLTQHPFHYVFVHYADPDIAGHAYGWGSPEWKQSVKRIDDYLGQVLTVVEHAPELVGKTVVIVTADHGGSEKGHFSPADPKHYRVPFIIWGAGVARGADLYDLNNTTRKRPGNRAKPERPDYNAAPPPIRNGGSGNLALDILGLGPIPGSTINAKQDLEWAGAGGDEESRTEPAVPAQPMLVLP